MKKLLLAAIVMTLAMTVPVPASAVDINVGIGLPPAVAFEGPPDVVVLPDTDDVYVIPDIDADIYFWDGWWWRLWDGYWYRSRYYDGGWTYYDRVPTFYFDVDPDWRMYYRGHEWHGHRWNYERIPDRRLRRHWRNWHRNNHWERQETWGIRGYRSRPEHEREQLRRQREERYNQRPEVRRHQQRMRERERERGGRQHEGRMREPER